MVFIEKKGNKLPRKMLEAKLVGLSSNEKGFIQKDGKPLYKFVKLKLVKEEPNKEPQWFNISVWLGTDKEEYVELPAELKKADDILTGKIGKPVCNVQYYERDSVVDVEGKKTIYTNLKASIEDIKQFKVLFVSYEEKVGEQSPSSSSRSVKANGN